MINASRPALAAARARVTIRHARKPEDMGITVSETEAYQCGMLTISP